MRQKYILGIYDQLINEIKHRRKTTDAEILSYLHKCTQDPFYLHRIGFTKVGDAITYSFENQVHCLHPSAASLAATDVPADPALAKMIGPILNELKLGVDSVSYYWISENNSHSLIIREACRNEALSAEERFFLYCFQMVKNENDTIMADHREKVFRLTNRVKTEHYIHRKQNALEHLSCALIKAIHPLCANDIYTLASDYGMVDCLKITFLYLEKLQLFLEEEYPSFLDQSQRVPCRTLMVHRFEIMDSFHQVESRLLEMNLSDALGKMAFAPLLKMMSNSVAEKITYREFHYSRSYLGELAKKFKQHEQAYPSDLEEWLFDLNYNASEFVRFETDGISREMDALESDLEKVVLLYHSQKYYNQRLLGSTAKWNQQLPCLKEQLVHWLDEEIEYLARKKNLESNTMVSATIIKIRTSLSVKQLCFFFGILVRSGILLPKRKTDVFRLICANFTTENTKNLAYESVKSSFYAADSATVKFLRSQIMLLLNYLKF
jgi:hypothetical protein